MPRPARRAVRGPVVAVAGRGRRHGTTAQNNKARHDHATNEGAGSSMSTVRLEAVKMDPATSDQDIPMQPASADIWDKKYRLKTKSGEAVDADIDGTYQRVAKARSDERRVGE